jgi:uncharacterized protein YbjT (DUF2867 family)
MEPTKVLVAGATGYIGRNVMQALHDAGFWVRALARDPKKLEGKPCDDIFVGQATQRETLRGLCDGGIDVVFSSLGFHTGGPKPTLWEIDYQGNLDILAEAKAAGVKHFIFISVVRGEEMARHSPVADAREQVARAIKASGLRYTIYRPAGYFNDVGYIFEAAAKRGVVNLYGLPEMRINPLHALDFGDEVARAITDPAMWNAEKNIGGPEVFTRRQIAEMAFKALGRPANIKVKPLWQFDLFARIMRLFHYNNYALFRFLAFAWKNQDMTGDPCGHRQLGDYFAELAAAHKQQPSTAH